MQPQDPEDLQGLEQTQRALRHPEARPTRRGWTIRGESTAQRRLGQPLGPAHGQLRPGQAITASGGDLKSRGPRRRREQGHPSSLHPTHTTMAANMLRDAASLARPCRAWRPPSLFREGTPAKLHACSKLSRAHIPLQICMPRLGFPGAARATRATTLASRAQRTRRGGAGTMKGSVRRAQASPLGEPW